MSNENDSRVILVTGTRTGIGREIAKHLTLAGNKVIGCSRGPSDLKLPGFQHYCVDVTVEADVKKFFAEIRKSYGRLDVLINNAGLLATGPTVFATKSAIETVFGTNVFSTFVCAREAAFVMKKQLKGRIINLTSIAVPVALVGSAIYGASKAAVEQLTRVMAKEFVGFGIMVNSLGLPPVQGTGMAERLPADVLEQTLAGLILKRKIQLDEIMIAVEFMLDLRNTAFTGQTLYLGGP